MQFKRSALCLLVLVTILTFGLVVQEAEAGFLNREASMSGYAGLINAHVVAAEKLFRSAIKKATELYPLLDVRKSDRSMPYRRIPQSALAQNYPNPFNPETWIPYRLTEEGDVTVRIYSASGNLVRGLELGHKPAGFYISKSKAAYWDGRNDGGESVASGVYFYTIQAGDFTAIRKMVVAK